MTLFDAKFQDGESACPRNDGGRLRYRISTTGPWLFDRDRATCDTCNSEALLWLEVRSDSEATVHPFVSGIDYDGLSWSALHGLYTAARQEVERLGGATRAPMDLRNQLSDLERAVRRREWEIIGSVNGSEQSLGRWQTKARCEQYVKERLKHAGDYEVAPGVIKSIRYRYEHRPAS